MKVIYQRSPPGRGLLNARAVLLAGPLWRPVSSRAVYSGVAEVSVYVADNFRGKGVGKALLKQLIARVGTEWYLNTPGQRVP